MDNGLIFPYPRAAVQAEPGDTKLVNSGAFRGAGGIVRPDLVVGEPLG